MPLSFNPDDLVRCSSVWLYDGSDEQVNVLHLFLAGTIAATDSDVFEDIAEYFVTLFDTYRDLMPDTTVHDRFELQNITTPAVYGSLAGTSFLDGTSAADALPPQDACLLLMNTLVSRGQGRLYLPTPVEDNVSKGELDPALQTAVLSMGSYLLGTRTMGNGTQLRYVVRHGTGSSFVFPVSRRAVTHIRIQRRRQTGRGG